MVDEPCVVAVFTLAPDPVVLADEEQVQRADVGLAVGLFVGEDFAGVIAERVAGLDVDQGEETEADTGDRSLAGFEVAVGEDARAGHGKRTVNARLVPLPAREGIRGRSVAATRAMLPSFVAAWLSA